MTCSKKNALLGLAMEETTKIVCDLDTDSKEKQFMLSGEKKNHIDWLQFYFSTALMVSAWTLHGILATSAALTLLPKNICKR